MRAIVSKDFFLSQTLPIKKIDRIAISAYGGDVSVAGKECTYLFALMHVIKRLKRLFRLVIKVMPAHSLNCTFQR